MRLFVGLGNPGREYEKTLHNAGFNAVDSLALKYSFSWVLSRKFQSHISEGYIGDKKIVLLKPLTYMNLSGEAVLSYIGYFNIPINEMMVIFDDMTCH